MKADGKPLPAVDTTLERVKTLQPVLNLSAVAKAAEMSVQTLSSKISRGTALTSDEAARLGRVLTAYGVTA
jgi:plasmid maintenance system antidote protein VapI